MRVFRNESFKALTEAGLTPIAFEILEDMYWINSKCDIVQLIPAENENEHDMVKRIFRWKTDFNTEYEKIRFHAMENTVFDISPITLYMMTYYGYLPGPVVINPSSLNPKTRYSYKILSIDKLSDKIIKINGWMFKYSEKYDAYASSSGCIMQNDTILRHRITKKHSHVVRLLTANNIGVHRIVYDAWVGISSDENHIHHKDVRAWNNQLGNFEEVSPEEHVEKHREVGNRNYAYSPEIVDETCRLMQEGHRPAEAARMVGIPAEAAVRFRAGQRADISGKYEYPEHGQYRRTKLTDDEVHEICKLFVEGKLSNAQIGKQFGYSPETIRDIRERRTWRDLSSQYEFSSDNPTTRKSVKGIHHAATISEEDVVRIYDMLHRGIPPKEVSLLTGISYFIVKKIRYKVRWRELTDRLDAQYANGEKGSTTIETVAQEKDLGE